MNHGLTTNAVNTEQMITALTIGKQTEPPTQASPRPIPMKTPFLIKRPQEQV
ncbi:hypothetical protein M406DRAFT_54097, partial [Cryphonectria parasitica EP155]